MDETSALDLELASWYQYLIVVLMWVVLIGRVNIIYEVSMMESQMAMAREVHL